MEPDMILVDSLDGIRMQDQGSWQEISPGQALGKLDAGGHQLR
jgi:hypothetical protein